MLAAAICAFVPQSEARAREGRAIRVGEPYRGAALDFQEEPAVTLVPATKVYYVRDLECDLYRYGLYWYFFEDGLWYRSRMWQGPFLHLQATSVPRSVRNVPLNYRRHWPDPPPLGPVREGYTRSSSRAK